MSRPLFNCLIRTHHITSRKKLQKVRRAASQLNVDWLLVRSGGCPGIMYAESHDASGLTDWVGAVQALRYKDFRCVARPAPITQESMDGPAEMSLLDTGVEETESITHVADAMKARRLLGWWKNAMGYG